MFERKGEKVRMAKRREGIKEKAERETKAEMEEGRKKHF